MIGTGGHPEVVAHPIAAEGVPTVWAEASAAFLGHPERSDSRTPGEFLAPRANFSTPGAMPPDPRPVDTAGPVEVSGETGDSPRPLENAEELAFPTVPTGPTTTARVLAREGQERIEIEEPGQNHGAGLAPRHR